MVIDLEDWESLVNKPVFNADGKDIGVVADVQPERILVTYGPITPDKYIIPKSSVERVEKGVVYLSETGKTVEQDFKYE